MAQEPDRKWVTDIAEIKNSVGQVVSVRGAGSV